MRYRYILPLLIILCMTSAYGQAKSYVIITHPEVSETELEKSDLKSMFLGRKKQWNNGSRIILGLQIDKVVFETFSRALLSKTMRQYLMYWKRMIMTGRGSMPKQFKTTADAVAFVKKTKGAIAVVVDSAEVTGVTKITIR